MGLVLKQKRREMFVEVEEKRYNADLSIRNLGVALDVMAKAKSDDGQEMADAIQKYACQMFPGLPKDMDAIAYFQIANYVNKELGSIAEEMGVPLRSRKSGNGD